jgi:DeoR/GlpR family transcriptional regulator of sugar metabolism
MMMLMQNIQEEIYELMKSNQSLTMKDIMKILNISEG